jgi:hypothetical protein
MSESSSGTSGIRNWKAFAAIAVAGAGLLLAFHYANALSYSAEPITATVVDAETGQALEGVNVLVLWDLQDPNARGAPYWIFEEAVTDKEGRFHFPGWGPKPVPRTLWGPAYRLGPEQPVIYLFKPGYPLESVSNPWESWMLGNSSWTGGLVRSSVWSGQTIEIKKFQGSRQQYIDRLALSTDGLPTQNCLWARIPRFTAALVAIQGDLVPRSIGLPTIQSLEAGITSPAGCASPREVLNPYLK